MSISVSPVAAPMPSKGPTPSADRLEASFLEEMLKYVGPLSARDATAEGESQFQTFLNREYAQALAAKLDLGLAKGLPDA